MQHGGEEAARALRCYTKARGQKGSVSVEGGQYWRPRGCCSLAVLPCQELFPLHLCTQDMSLQLQKGLGRKNPRKHIVA